MRSLLVLIAAILVHLSAPSHADERAPRDEQSTTDHDVQVRRMFRVAACGGDDAVPATMPTKAIATHCARMARTYASYRRAWADRATAFIAGLRPTTAPATVVYPFGGGDLTSALVVFPTAAEITTISLEAAGDVRMIDRLARTELIGDLEKIGHDIRRLYRSAHSTTKSLQAAGRARLPGTLMFALAGLAVHGLEPVSLRYFDLARDGSIVYLDDAELDRRAAAAQLANRKRRVRRWSLQESVFGNVEIQFRAAGQPSSPMRTYRHLMANLDDAHQAADDRVLLHLRAKGKVSVITKAASFLLWYDDFAQIRDYLLAHVAWMISDATGLPGAAAEAAGFEQLTYGEFVGPYFTINKRGARDALVKRWAAQPHRKLAFRFGYPDAEGHAHLLVTRPRAASGGGPGR